MAEGNEGKGTVSDKKSIEDAAEAFDRYLEREREKLRIQKDQAKLSGQFVKDLALQNRENELIARQLAANLEKMKSMTDEAERTALAEKMLAEMTKELKDNLQDVVQVLQKLATGATVTKDLRTEMNGAADSATRLSAAASEAESATTGLDSSISSLVGSLGMGMTQSSGFASSLMKIRGELNTLNKEGSEFNSKLFAMAMAKQAVIGFANKLGSGISDLGQSSSKAAANLDKLAGSTENSFEEILNLSGGLIALGISMEDITNTVGTLMNETAMLGEKVSDVNSDSLRLASSIVGLGVDAKQLAGTINVLSRGFGLSFEESTRFFESLIVDSKLAGQSVTDLSDAFAQASDRLLMTSTNIDEIQSKFESLNKVSRELGVEISDIVNLTERFDKFKDAAEAAGKLNAQFGLQLSMSKLQRLENEDRLLYIKQQMTAQGMLVNSLSAMEKKFLQTTLGIKDQATMLSLLGTAQEQQRDAAEDLNALLAEQMDSFTALKSALAELALVFSPVIIFLVGIVDVFAKVIGSVAGFLNSLKASESGFAAFAGQIISIGASVLLLVAGFALLKKTFTGLGGLASGVGTKLGTGLSKTAVGAKSFFEAMSFTNIAKFGAIMAIFAASIGIAAFGLSYLAEAMQGMSGEVAEQFVYSLGIIMLGMLAFVGGMAYLAPALAAAIGVKSAALLAFGGTLLLVGGGLAFILNSATSLAKELGNLSDGAFGTLVDGLVTLTKMRSPLADLKEDLEALNEMTNNIDGMVIMQSTGESRTIMMASENIIKGKTEGSMDINVKISMDDKINVTNQLKIMLDGKELSESLVPYLDEGG